MDEIGKEGILFLQALLSGMIVCMTYVCIRKFRRIVKHNLICISVEDMIFWLGTAIYLFVQIYHTSDGSIRWYFALGVVIGAVFVAGICKLKKKLNKKLYVKKGANSQKNVDKPREKR